MQLVVWFVEQYFLEKAISSLFYWRKKRSQFHCNLSGVWCNVVNVCSLILIIVLWQNRMQHWEGTGFANVLKEHKLKIIVIFKGLFIYLFIFRGEGRENERERNHQCVVASHTHPPPPGTWPATQACALTGNRTSNTLVHRPTLNPLSHTSQGRIIVILLSNSTVLFEGWNQILNFVFSLNYFI